MIGETVFQVLFACMVVAFVFLWLRHLMSIGVTHDKFYTATEGAANAIGRGLLLGASVIGMVVYSVDPHLMAWAALPLPPVVRWLGLFPGIFALLLFRWVLQWLGHNFSTSLTIGKDQTLVVDGPYRRVRHPMYTSFVLLWIGYSLVSANWFIGSTGISGFLLAILVRTPREEKMMIGRFGDEYIAYMSRTGRYLPRLLKKKTRKGAKKGYVARL